MTPEFDPNQLEKLPTKQLISLIVQQQQIIEQLQQEVERLKVSLKLDSQTSSLPPSTDLLKKPEKPQGSSDKTKAPKRKPGGQPGHLGSTRKGFGRVDRYELLRPQECPHCGSVEFRESPLSVHRQQVAQLVAHPIEVVEYQQHTCACVQCGQTQTAAWPESIVPGQDLSVELQSLLVWLLGQVFLDLIDEAFAQHKQWRETQDHRADESWAVGFKLRVTLSLQQWIGQAGYEAGKLLRSLQGKAEQWWYFLDHPVVPPDNNLAERSLRLAVTKRKVSGGSRSMKRFAQTADLLSVVQTLRRQGRSVIAFFQEALVAHVKLGTSAPSLLPEPIP